MPLLSSFHQRCGTAKFYVSSCFNEKISHLQKPSTASQSQCGFLRLLCLSIDVCSFKQHKTPVTEGRISRQTTSICTRHLITKENKNHSNLRVFSPTYAAACWVPAHRRRRSSYLAQVAVPPSPRGLLELPPSGVCILHHWPLPG